MKKILSVILVAVMTTALSACGGSTSSSTVITTAASTVATTEAQTSVAETETTTETETAQLKSTGVTVRLGGLKGPTSMGMVKLLDDNEAGTTANKYEFTMAGSADELTPKLLKGDIDILAVPSNLGAILYNKSEGAVEMLAINTLGVVYIVEKGGSDINSLEDLKGQTIYATSKGSTPEFALTYLLAEHGIDIDKDVTMEWLSEPAETVAKMAQADHAIALLPQPFVTVAQTQIEGLRVAIDLNKEWADLDNGSQMVTAGLIVRKEFLEQNPEAVTEFLKEYKASTEWINANVDEGAKLVEKYDIVKAAIAKKAIPLCNISYIDGDEMKTATEGYLKVLYDIKPEAVGGKLPGEDFYYAK